MLFSFEDSSDFYVIAIDTLGDYAVLKNLNGTISATSTQGTNTDLNTGMDAINQISVTTTSAGNFEITFNGGANPVTFTDSSSVLTGTEAGFYATVGSSSMESFPTTPEDVRFKMTAPISVP